ncbi:MAG: hypothetical protein RL179_300 [Planctomycetota bacterium]
MSMLDREEYIEQLYFFQTLRERIKASIATQEVLEKIDQEILSTTKLPMAIQFLATEIKDSGLLSTGFKLLGHYFTPFQAFIIKSTEDENRKFSIDTGLHVLEKMAKYLADTPTPSGLFVFQFEILSRNKLGYDEGVLAMADDPLYPAVWRDFIIFVSKQIGLVEFAELVYLRSEYYLELERKQDPNYEPPVPPLFQTKEGRIAKANLGRDPFFLFAALQRQLNYPEVPRSMEKESPKDEMGSIRQRVNDLEMRIKLVEAEVKGNVDLAHFGKPEILANLPKDDAFED